jgi:hypothetical protein
LINWLIPSKEVRLCNKTVQNNICRDMQKIEGLVRDCMSILHNICNITKRLKTSEDVEKYFPAFLTFADCTKQPIPRPVDKE